MRISSTINLSRQNNINLKDHISLSTFKEAVKSSDIQKGLGVSQNFVTQPKLPLSYSKLGIQKTPFGEEINLYRLSNGHRVGILKKEGTTIVKTFVNCGSMNENDKIRGISHFIEHNLFNGSKNYAPGAIFENTSKMGGDANASTSFSLTDYYLSMSSIDEPELEEYIKMQSDMINNPLFTSEMIEKEKGPVTSEISMMNDDMPLKTYQSVIKNLFQINSTKEDDLIGGSIKTINALTRNDVLDYWNTYYTPDNMCTVVVGDVDPDKTIDLIAKNFTGAPKNNPEAGRTYQKLTPITTPKRVDYISKTDNGSTIIAGFASPTPKNSKDEIIMDALSTLLSGYDISRLTQALRPLNASCGVESEKVGFNNDPQVFSIFVNAPKENTQKALDTLYATLEQIKNYPPTDDEMQIIKSNMNKSLAMAYETADYKCQVIGNSMLTGTLNNISKTKEMIDSLTSQDLVNAAQKYLDLNKVSIGVLHAKGTTEGEINTNFLKSGYSNNIINQPLSFKGELKKEFTKDIKEYRTQDNSHIILNNSDSDICYFNWKLTSYKSTPKNLAIPYVLTEILNNGSAYKNKEQYGKYASMRGIDYDFDSNGFSITLNANCLKDKSTETINMLKETLLNPRFDEKELEAAKTKIDKYCESLNKDASTTLVSQLYPEFFPSAKEIREGLKSITLNDIKGYYDDMMKNASSNCTVTAPFEKNPTLDNTILSNLTIQNHEFKDQKPHLEEIYKPTEKSKVIVDTEERNQAQVLKSYSFNMSGNIVDEIKFELLNTILGGSATSRLFSDLREKQKLAYSVGSQIQSFGDTGVLTMHILTTTDDKAQGDVKYDNLQKSLDGFEFHADKLTNELISKEELEGAKKALKQQLAADMELPSSATMLLSINAQEPYGIKRIDEYYKAIDSITPQDIKNAACHVFKNNPIVSILASPDTINNQREYLNSIGDIYSES